MRDLIRRDQERAAKIVRMQRLVDEGLDSGVSVESMEDIEAAARAETGVAKSGDL